MSTINNPPAATPTSTSRRMSSEISSASSSAPDKLLTTPDRAQGREKLVRHAQSNSLPVRTLNDFWTGQPSSTPASTRLESLGRTRLHKQAASSASLSNVRAELIIAVPAATPTDSTAVTSILTTPTAEHSTPSNEVVSTSNSKGITSSDLTVTTRSSSSALSSHKLKKKTPPPPPSVTHPSLDSYTYKVIVEGSAKVGKTDSVFSAMRLQVLKGLALLQEVDADAAFLPKPSSRLTVPIYDSASFPVKQFITGMNYFSYVNDYSLFSTTKTESGRWIKFSAVMGFKVDPQEFLPAMKVDLIELGMSISIKGVQSLDTCANIVFLGAPQNINKEYAKEVMDLHLRPLEARLVELDPATYPPSLHSLPWPEYSMVCDQPQGLFEPYQKGMNRTQPPRERRSLQLVCAKDQFQRLASLIRAAKQEGVWTSEFGQGSCYPVEVVTADSTKVEKEHYRDMVETHMSAQLGLAHETFSGVKNDRVEMEFRRLPDAKGPRTPVTYSFRQILKNMRFLDKPLWLCLIRTDKRQGFDVFFDGNCPITLSYVQEFLKCPAAQINHWLLKRGLVKSDVETFLKKIFNNTQLLLVSKARYNAEIKLAQLKTRSGDGDMDIVSASRRKDTFINPDLGLSSERLALRKAKLEATVCNLGKFDFTRPQDLRSLSGDGSVAEFSVDASLAHTIYNINDTEPDDDSSEDDNEDKEDHDYQEVSNNTRVHFEMELPNGETSERIILSPHQQGVSSLRKTKKSTSDDTGTDMDMQEVSYVGYRQFASELWSRAPEDYPTIFAILDILTNEYIQSVTGEASEVPVEPTAYHLVDDCLRDMLQDAADEEDMMEFLEEMRMWMEESKKSDEDAQKTIDRIFDPESSDYVEDTGKQLGDELHDPLDAEGNTVRPPSSTVEAMQIDVSSDGVDNPQGSLLPAPVVGATAPAGDVETARPGGSPG